MDTTGIDWQRQNFAKGGSAEAAPHQMNPKTMPAQGMTMHSKIAKPTTPCGGMVGKAGTGYANGGMVKGYADGGELSDGEWARGENYGDGTTGDERVAMARDPNYVEPAKTTALPDAEPVKGEDVKADEPKQESFKEAFARNRKAGAKTFMWNGKKYTTEMAGASKPAAKVPDYGDESARMMARSRNAARPVKSAAPASSSSSRIVNPTFDADKIDPKTMLPKRS